MRGEPRELQIKFSTKEIVTIATKNEESAIHLRAWQVQQEQMVRQQSEHITALLTLKGNSTEAHWTDEAIARANDAIEELTKSLDYTRKCLQLAENDQLHNPRYN